MKLEILNQSETVPKTCIVIKGALGTTEKAIYFAVPDNTDVRDFVTDGKALAQFMQENLPAITFSIMVKECLSITKF